MKTRTAVIAAVIALGALVAADIMFFARPEQKHEPTLGEGCASGLTGACQLLINIQTECKKYYDTHGVEGNIADCALLVDFANIERKEGKR